MSASNHRWEGREVIPFGKPLIGPEERAAVDAVLKSGVLTRGPKVELFEQSFAEFAGGGMAVAISSCMAGLHLTLMALGIGKGHEVIVPAMTHPAVAHAVELLGATPVFVDASLPTGNCSPEAIKAAMGSATRAITVVHFLGRPCEMNSIRAIGEKYGVPVVEDCALAVGAATERGHVGLLSDAGCFSFYPAKHISTGEGGMVLTRNPELAHAIAELRCFGLPWTGLIVRPPKNIGLNYRLTEMQAAMGIEQLKKLHGFLKERARNWGALSRAMPKHIDSSGGAHYAFSFFPDTTNVSRETLKKRMREDGIESAVYYGHVVPLLPYYARKYEHKPGQFPVAEKMCRESLALPVGPHLKPGDTDRIIRSYRENIAA